MIFHSIVFVIFSSLFPLIESFYNPIPYGSIIISSTRTISVLPLKEYPNSDTSTVIFTAASDQTIVHTIYDGKSRDLYILFSNASDSTNLYLARLASQEKLDPNRIKLPIKFNHSEPNQFTSDVINKRAFVTDQHGHTTMFSMAGLMSVSISPPTSVNHRIRSMAYHSELNRLFVITDPSVYACSGFDDNQLQCCQYSFDDRQFHTITFDSRTNYRGYATDAHNGIYRVNISANGCPIDFEQIYNDGDGSYNHLVVHDNLYVFSKLDRHFPKQSLLMIGNATRYFHRIPINKTIVSLHISYPKMKSNVDLQTDCFHGLSYHDYRIALVLAAIFGTIMGIFMCFNALFCIDFFMTKRIVKELRRQIPHNLLEDRWNKLIQEKYAKLALETNRKKDDPPPKRKSSDINTKTESTMTFTNPLPKLSAYIRHKSESYISRRRSDDYRQSKRLPILAVADPHATTTGNNTSQEAPEQRQSRETRAKSYDNKVFKNEEEFL